MKKISLVLLVLVLVIGGGLVAVEQILRAQDRAITKRSKGLGYHLAFRGGIGPGGGLKEGFKATFYDESGNPTVQWANNAQGFRHERDFSQSPGSGVLRILALGDSFMVGVGVSQNDNFAKRLEDWSSRQFGPTEVLISGIEHPAKGLKYLKDYGYQWQPHLVLVGVTLGSDIAQSYVARDPRPIGFKNGLEEVYLPEACFRKQSFFDKTRSWLADRRVYKKFFHDGEPIDCWYRDDGKVRLFDPVNGLGSFVLNSPEIDLAYERLFAILAEYKTFCKAKGIQLAVVIFPQPFQVETKHWQASVGYYGLQVDAFDLMMPNRRILEFCKAEAIVCADPTGYMQAYYASQQKELYLPGGNMHWTSLGHEAVLDGSKETFSQLVAPFFGRQPAAIPQ